MAQSCTVGKFQVIFAKLQILFGFVTTRHRKLGILLGVQLGIAFGVTSAQNKHVRDNSCAIDVFIKYNTIQYNTIQYNLNRTLKKSKKEELKIVQMIARFFNLKKTDIQLVLLALLSL